MECVLGDLLGGLGSTEHPVQDAEHRPPVAVVELAEGRGVTPRDPHHERGIVTSLVAGYDLNPGDG